MTHYTFPSDYEETFACGYCKAEFLEDDLVEYERDKWACDACARANDEEAAAMQETAEDDRAHAMRDKALGL